MTAPPPPARADPLRAVVAAAVVAAVTGALYWPALSSGFHGDDFMILHRLRTLGSAGDVLRFFQGEFFEYYRPLAFVLHAIDYAVAGPDPRQFHLTNIALHLTSATLVLLIGWALSPRSLAGPLAALLFSLHASNHQAVVWVSARFDLLATAFSLAAIWCLVRDVRGARAAAPVLFLAAVLSKESAVALPVAAVGAAVFLQRARTGAAVRLLLPWLGALIVYALMRHLAGGLSPVGGASRIPKLVVFAGMLGGLLLLADGRWLRLRGWLRDHRSVMCAVGASCLVTLAAAAAAGGRVGRLAADKLAVAGFAGFYLASPVIDLFARPFYLDPHAPMYWAGGVIALGAAAIILSLIWRPLLDDRRMWFLGAMTAATLLPVSALTEGTRYLYLPSAPVSLMAGLCIAERTGRTRTLAFALAALVLVVSSIQISLKQRDWIWAGRMTAAGAALVEAARPPGCGGDQVVFLTAPVGVHGVYTHFYYETFEMPRGCTPELFQVLVRVMHVDSAIDVKWEGPARLVITAPAYRDNFVVSEDLRRFDRELRGDARRSVVSTPLGELRAEPVGSSERLTLTLAPGVRAERIRFFYYSAGRMRPLPFPF